MPSRLPTIENGRAHSNGAAERASGSRPRPGTSPNVTNVESSSNSEDCKAISPRTPGFPRMDSGEGSFLWPQVGLFGLVEIPSIDATSSFGRCDSSKSVERQSQIAVS